MPIRVDDDVRGALQELMGRHDTLNEGLRSVLFGPGTSVDAPRKQFKKAQHIAALRASDPLATILGRDDIEHGNMELPSSGSVATLDAVANPFGSAQGKASVQTSRRGRAPLLKPKDRK